MQTVQDAATLAKSWLVSTRARAILLKSNTKETKTNKQTKNMFFGGGPTCSDVLLLFDITPAHAGVGVVVGRCGGGGRCGDGGGQRWWWPGVVVCKGGG